MGKYRIEADISKELWEDQACLRQWAVNAARRQCERFDMVLDAASEVLIVREHALQRSVPEGIEDADFSVAIIFHVSDRDDELDDLIPEVRIVDELTSAR